ncbi:hypothetical protein HMPREF3192_00107 [Atopobium deltae]|uniref:Uncharacterized protein n=1 Tax=Atopobium deltae TaxID=1393034 RepID=A0A133XXN7_9ACTN|nr:hypothetical protein HMPREF3192_00107 [Atopobium deltae]
MQACDERNISVRKRCVSNGTPFFAEGAADGKPTILRNNPTIFSPMHAYIHM